MSAMLEVYRGDIAGACQGFCCRSQADCATRFSSRAGATLARKVDRGE
jgi:hypothetical protein